MKTLFRVLGAAAAVALHRGGDARARRAAEDGAAQGQGRDLQAHGAGLLGLGGLGSLRLGTHGGTGALRPDLLAGLLALPEVMELALDAGVLF